MVVMPHSTPPHQPTGAQYRTQSTPPTKTKGEYGQGYLPDKAAQEDLNTKAAWGIDRLRSCYLTMIQLPKEVSAGDHATARAITGRIDAAIEIRGRWTDAERRRLYSLRKKWERRASGRDVYFNLRGWRGHSSGHQGRGQADDDRRAFQVAMLVEGVREILHDDDGE